MFCIKFPSIFFFLKCQVLADILPKEALLWKINLLTSAALYANSRLHAVQAEVLLLVRWVFMLVLTFNLMMLAIHFWKLKCERSHLLRLLESVHCHLSSANSMVLQNYKFWQDCNVLQFCNFLLDIIVFGDCVKKC